MAAVRWLTGLLRSNMSELGTILVLLGLALLLWFMFYISDN